MPPSLPGGSIAPGSLFTIDGLRLGGGNSATHVHVIAGSSNLEARLMAADAERLEAIMPPQTPPGESQLVVTRDGMVSRPFPLRIASAFGIFSRNGKGWGAGEVRNSDGSPNTPQVPAHPGEMATMVGTGLGSATAVEVFIGGRRAASVPSAKARPTQPGREEISFQLARNTLPGCHVPVLVRLGASVSNAVTMSIAAKGMPCPESAWPAALILLARVMVHVRLNVGIPADFTEDIGASIFPPEDAGANLPPVSQLLPPLGMCTSVTGRWPSDFASLPNGAGRDAGPGFSITGPKGTRSLVPSPSGFYKAILGGGIALVREPKPLFLDFGEYRVSSPGGRDIGDWATEGRYSAPLKPLLPVHVDTIDRSQGVTVKWGGGNARERVAVVAVNVDPLSSGAGFCLCMAPGTAGHWYVPPMWLANLPASPNAPGVPLNYLLVATLPAEVPPRFAARGVAGGALVFSTVRIRTVRYK
jgi:uncharacterized protein (TIGR03437 family)